MFAYQSRYRSAAALYWVAVVMQAGAGITRAAEKRWDAWRQSRRVNAASLTDLGMMSEHELRDIGLSPVDVRCAAWDSFDRNPERLV